MSVGKLKFKGSFGEKQEKNEQKIRNKVEREELAQDEQQFLEKIQEKGPAKRVVIDKPLQDGLGMIFTSGTSVHGQDTQFLKQLEAGDFLVILNEQTLEMESREILTMLNQKSLLIREAFGQDIPVFKPYQFRKKPTVEEMKSLEDRLEEKFAGVAKKIKKQKQTLEMRQKSGMWSYKTDKMAVDGELSREDLVLMRSKQSRDRHCWY
ncbi:unnamed protein product (macronuclear) [Paramecium tetraurelia]|uniref:PDZ domain-containing protein n=1 Tax=Paramecium tetraurelia TaxID=5888 RepID=A0DLL1_PARTE|nr:uncharacterized protein GSPATT00018246001 [Paramecium tetraurelia]CAK83928.1 unnamed protein product [Paramecium tetraurelia]|eukprot:XP_001451325.1 hypothetical protein (macronuclear) [Paramecium tetraurelia strain d4-2]